MAKHKPDVAEVLRKMEANTALVERLMNLASAVLPVMASFPSVADIDAIHPADAQSVRSCPQAHCLHANEVRTAKLAMDELLALVNKRAGDRA